MADQTALRTTETQQALNFPNLDGDSNPDCKEDATRVLVVDDNPINLLIAAAPLCSAGFQVATASTGSEALAAVIHSPYHAVLMDCHMPQMNGLEATRRIRIAEANQQVRRPKLIVPGSRLPIIAFTGSAILGEPERCLEAGMDAFLWKPVDAKLLLSTLNTWIGARPSNAVATQSPALYAKDFENAPMDCDGFIRTCLDDVDFALKILTDFEKAAHDTLHQIGAAAAIHDIGQMRAVAHRLKGSAGYLHAAPLREAAGRLEAASGEPGAVISVALCAALKNEISRCLAYLPRLRDRAQSGR